MQTKERVFSYRPGTMNLSKLFEDLQVHNDVNLIFKVPMLNPADCPPTLIVDSDYEDPEARTLVDGYKRAAGMLRWCAANGVDPGTITVNVVLTDDSDLLDVIDRTTGAEEQEAIDRVLELAK